MFNTEENNIAKKSVEDVSDSVFVNGSDTNRTRVSMALLNVIAVLCIQEYVPMCSCGATIGIQKF